MRPEPVLRAVLFAALVLAAACPGPSPAGADGGTGGGSGQGGGAGGGTGSVDGGDPNGFAPSAKGNVRFKRNERLTVDFGNALGLPYEELCKELGIYSCTMFVHPLALGGVDPYGTGLYEPLPFTGVTSPIVVDRVALAGCTQRVNADLTNPTSAVIFKNITVGPGGKVDPTSAAAKTALDTLYKRVLLRTPTADEVAHLQKLATDIEATGQPNPGQAWLTLSCFAVITSVESLFY